MTALPLSLLAVLLLTPLSDAKVVKRKGRTKVFRSFFKNPECPTVSPLPPAKCRGQHSTCWSPGVRDTDCPGKGLCCYDGCANTCKKKVIEPKKTTVKPSRRTTRRSTTRIPIKPPPVYLPPKPTLPPPVYFPPPTTTTTTSTTTTTTTTTTVPIPTPTPPLDAYLPPATTPRMRYPVHPGILQPSILVPQVIPPPTTQPPHQGGTCPRVAPIQSCAGQFSTCWSVGVPDIDCPNWGLCCYDGCANTCLGQQTPAPRITTPRHTYPTTPRHTYPTTPRHTYPMTPRTTQLPRNPCNPSPCGQGSMCIPQEGKPTCKCPPRLMPNPTPEVGCIKPDPCASDPCGPGCSPCHADTICQVTSQGTAVCRQCIVDDDCSLDMACSSYSCVNPCISSCSNSDLCRVMIHRPICGYNYEPPQEEIIDNFVIGERYVPQSLVDDTDSFVIGGEYHDVETPSFPRQPVHFQPRLPDPTNPFVVGGQYQERDWLAPACGSRCGEPRMMMMMNTSGLRVIGYSSKRRRRRRESVTLSRYWSKML